MKFLTKNNSKNENSTKIEKLETIPKPILSSIEEIDANIIIPNLYLGSYQSGSNKVVK